MIWCLDFHATYRCRHSGACCRAGWPIPFEDGTVAARGGDGTCTFLDQGAHRCSIHRAQGLRRLPVSCRMFPRVVLQDARGAFVSLSHFCPTAAALLFEAPGVGAIVAAPPALADVGGLDGLDARNEWPPLLRARVLMDMDSYAAWERRALALLTHDRWSPADALAELQDVTARICAWSPGSSALRDVVDAAFDASDISTYSSFPTNGVDRAVKRWLAARLFGSWSAYQGDGLAATVRYVRSCYETLQQERSADDDPLEAIRRTDLCILHAGTAVPGERATRAV